VLVNVVVPAAVTVDVNPIKLAIAAGADVLPVPPLVKATIPDMLSAVPPIERLVAVPVKPVPAPVNDVALKTPVLGTNESFVDETVTGLFPVVLVRIAGYQVVADVVLSVVATFVAFVAVPAVVADPAEPSIFTPVKDWLALDRLRAIEVVPTYRLELPNTPLGIVPDN
jgi:hypothetical protein